MIPSSEGGSVSKKVFVSYASSEFERANALRHLVSLFSTSVFLDRESISPGDRWELFLAESLRESDLFLVLWTHAASSSSWVARECDAALQNEKCTVVPVLGDSTPLPEKLRRVQAISGIPLMNEILDLQNDLLRRGVSRPLVAKQVRKRLIASGIELTSENKRAVHLLVTGAGFVWSRFQWSAFGLAVGLCFGSGLLIVSHVVRSNGTVEIPGGDQHGGIRSLRSLPSRLGDASENFDHANDISNADSVQCSDLDVGMDVGTRGRGATESDESRSSGASNEAQMILDDAGDDLYDDHIHGDVRKTSKRIISRYRRRNRGLLARNDTLRAEKIECITQRQMSTSKMKTLEFENRKVWKERAAFEKKLGKCRADDAALQAKIAKCTTARDDEKRTFERDRARWLKMKCPTVQERQDEEPGYRLGF